LRSPGSKEQGDSHGETKSRKAFCPSLPSLLVLWRPVAKNQADSKKRSVLGISIRFSMQKPSVFFLVILTKKEAFQNGFNFLGFRPPLQSPIGHERRSDLVA